MKYKVSLSDKSYLIVDNQVKLLHRNQVTTVDNLKVGDNITINQLDKLVSLEINSIEIYNGELEKGIYKDAEHFSIGDKVLNNYNQVNIVIDLLSGKEEMFDVILENGKSFTVNLNHLLYLYNPNNDTELVISVNDWLTNPLSNFKIIDKKTNQYLSFEIKPCGIGHFYGFSLDGNQLFQDGNGIIHHNSGKSVTLNNILAHVCKFSDDVQMIGIDLKQVEFTRFLGVRGVKAVAWDIVTATEMLVAFRRIMKKKYSMLQEYKENNQYKIKNEKVNYYELADGSVFQFDEIFQVTQDLDKTNRDYSKLIQREGFENGRINTIYTIEELYEGIKKGKIINPQIPERKGMNCWLDDTSIRKIEQRVFRPKLTIMMCDELNELMEEEYKYVEQIREVFNSLTALGRAAGFHCVFAMQNAGGSAMTGNMRKNIHMSVVLGDFDSGTSMNLYDRDYGNMSRPEIKGRGIMNNGRDIIEFQSYYATETDTWLFDEKLKWTYENKEFKKQCEVKNIEIDDSGFVEQIPRTSLEETKEEKDVLLKKDKHRKPIRFNELDDDDFGLDDFELDDIEIENLQARIDKLEKSSNLEINSKPKLKISSNKKTLKLSLKPKGDNIDEKV